MQRGYELPLGPSTDPKWASAQTVAATAKNTQAGTGGLVVLEQKRDNLWAARLDLSPRNAPASLGNCAEGVTYVNAFVMPFHPQLRHQIWLMARFDKIAGNRIPGSWGKGSGSHGSAGQAPAIAAGELMWRLHKRWGGQFDVEVLAVNQQTATYSTENGPGGMARSTQSEHLASYQCLIFHGREQFEKSAYASGATRVADSVDPPDLRPGQFTVKPVPVSPEQKEKLLARGIEPKEEQVTYRPTQNDRRADAERRQLSIPMAVADIAPRQGPVIATALRIRGANLSHVMQIGFGEGQDRIWSAPEVTSESALTVHVPRSATTGKIAVKRKDGTVLESEQSFTVTTG